MAVISIALLMPFNQVNNEHRSKIPTLNGLSGQKNVPEDVIEILPEPFGNRNHESLFLSMNDLLGKNPAGSLFQDIFRLEAIQFQLNGDIRNIFGQFMVEKRDTGFQGMGHGHPIHLCQNISWQIEDLIHKQVFGQIVLGVTFGN